jgi:amino acid transporter
MATTHTGSSSRPGLTNSGLRSQCLSFPEVLGQSIAHISPTLTPAVVAPLVFASSGNGTCFAYLLATIALVLVGININQFAKGSASSGALYAFVAQGLGPVCGILAGWALVYASVTTAGSVYAGSLNYIQVLLHQMGINIPVIIPCLLGIALAWWIAFKDVKLSAKVMLTLEFISVVLILIVSFVVLIKNGFRLDLPQFNLKGVTPEAIRQGLMLAFFSFVGFESATTLGDEAKNPLKSIPRAVLGSVLIAGAFFIFTSYAEIQGFAGAATTLDKSDAPFNYLAIHFGMGGIISTLISIGAVISMWGCMLAALNAASRIFFAMSRHGLFPSSVGGAHSSNATPHIAVHICTAATVIIMSGMIWYGVHMFDMCGYLGTLSSYGFLLAYIMISIAVPVAMARKNMLRAWHVLISLLAVGICGMALVSCVYPVPALPYNYFPYIFIGYMLLGVVIMQVVRKRTPDIMQEIARDLDLVQDNFRTTPKPVLTHV